MKPSCYEETVGRDRTSQMSWNVRSFG